INNVELYGVDISESQLKQAYHPKVNLLRADVTCLPFPENFFDIVIASEILEHVIEPKKFIEEIFRIGKPDCIVVIVVPNDFNFLIGRLWMFDIYSAFYNYGHLHNFSSVEKIKNLINKKFKILKVIPEKGNFILISWIINEILTKFKKMTSTAKSLPRITDIFFKNENSFSILKHLLRVYKKFFAIHPIVHLIYFLVKKYPWW
ncbi:MAG: class I SAM-dependent methyltransferase, partial [Candidatus Omnitrophica bacterium]|nr:class I SAM-dependent methyltransferase [Candidatus Omnitrophota bacterium]